MLDHTDESKIQLVVNILRDFVDTTECGYLWFSNRKRTTNFIVMGDGWVNHNLPSEEGKKYDFWDDWEYEPIQLSRSLEPELLGSDVNVYKIIYCPIPNKIR